MKTNNKKQNSGGFLSAIAALFKGGAAAGSGVSGAAATGGIFASNAGILGLLLGGATIAAGAGAVYHFAGNTTNTASNTPALFQNSYFEEEAAKAGAERSNSQDRHNQVNSSIGMFSEQARKSGLGFEVQEEQPQDNSQAEDNNYSEASSYGSSGSPVDYSASAASSSSPKGNRLTSKSMGSFSGGGSSSTGSSVPRMKSMGGLSGGVNSKFASMKSAALAESRGSATAMASAKKASISKGRSVSARGRRSSARSQAMFANAMGSKAAYSSSVAGARTSAQAAFTGETTGTGDVAEGVLEGAGLGGAGISLGDGLKSNDPGNSNSIKNVPQPGATSNVSPWKDLEIALLATLATAAALLIAGSMCASAAKNAPDAISKAGWLVATMALSAAVVAAGTAIMVMGGILAFKPEYKQTGLGITYMIAGGLMLAKGIKLLAEAAGDYSKVREDNLENAKADLQNKIDNETDPNKKAELQKKMDLYNSEEGEKAAWQDSKQAKADYKAAQKELNTANNTLENTKDTVRQEQLGSDNNKAQGQVKQELSAQDSDIEQKVNEDPRVQQAQKAQETAQNKYNAAEEHYKNRTSLHSDESSTVTETKTTTTKESVDPKTGEKTTITTETVTKPQPQKTSVWQQMGNTLNEQTDNMLVQKTTDALGQTVNDLSTQSGDGGEAASDGEDED